MSNKGSLSNRFQDFGAAPDESAWTNISAVISKKKKKKAVIWWIVGTSGVAASLIFSVFFFRPFTNNTQPTAITAIIIDSLEQEEYNLSRNLKEVKQADFIKPVETTIEESLTMEERDSDQKHHFKKAKNSVFKNKKRLYTGRKSVQAIEPNKVIRHNKKEFMETAPKLQRLLAQESSLIRVADPALKLSKITVQNRQLSRWKLGIETGSSRSLNENNFLDNTISTTDNNQGTPYEAVVPDNAIYFRKINRPISLSIVVNFQLTPKLYIHASPSFSLLRGMSDMQLTFEQSGDQFLSVGSGLGIGYYFLQKRRWALDAELETNFEKMLFTSKFNEDKVPLQFIGSKVALGFSYHLNEKISLRIAPNYSWVYGKSEDIVQRQFQALNHIGLGLAISKQF
ncbi:hypothetical protein DNU06_12290 [Putridiphycobacter roseus]|uniref:Outer membrane protein beta-barrel domain-containing protein n=1 Tax=Putridiphycobacter roseus TaxID=2219161 RepID=A0A2W1MXS3_9FLAO|nr:hypothetical protein [Putridiphycobacter roseus]PZE16627.1 hypothetical protein DNU06_12290 [Putridiphycobacter roseus]